MGLSRRIAGRDDWELLLEPDDRPSISISELTGLILDILDRFMHFMIPLELEEYSFFT